MAFSNSEISDILKTYADLSELHGGNPFKIKSYAAASFRIDKLPEPLFGKDLQALESMEGVGKSIAQKIHELFSTGTIRELSDLIDATPEGVREIMRIKGIGPKKVAVIWKEMGVESVGELLYACRENRLAQYKGFGLKSQESVIKQIEFIYASLGKFHYAKAYQKAQELLELFRNISGVSKAELTREIRRKCEILTQVDFLLATTLETTVEQAVYALLQPTENTNEYTYQGLPIRIQICSLDQFAFQLFSGTGVPEHNEKVLGRITGEPKTADTEEALYAQAQIPFIVPELRENRGEIELATSGSLPELISFTDLKGPLHNHSTWSDGLHSIEVMARHCMDNGYAYLGMADHSKSAFYANGLNEERVVQQQKEIHLLNQKLAGSFRIFAGIECDILYDGQLDYSPEILKTFDYVVASVHSILKMNEEKAMSRLIRAIENPFTTILGHPTGRLLLMREGYPVDHRKLIDACAANGVVMELNANPYRLDMDWRYISYALEKGVMISINPDAHEVEGFHDMFFGIEVARKGMLVKEACFNAQGTHFLEEHFARKKG